jgi:uncharacterized protein YegP (UPF0339 family)
MNAAKFVVYKDGVWWHFDLRAANGKVLYRSKRYASPQTARDAITVLVNLCKQNPKVIQE